MTDIRQRIIKKALETFRANDTFDPGIKEVGLAAAREMAILIRERLEARHQQMRAEYSAAWAKAEDKDDTDYEEGRSDASGHSISIVDDLLASLVSAETPLVSGEGESRREQDKNDGAAIGKGEQR